MYMYLYKHDKRGVYRIKNNVYVWNWCHLILSGRRKGPPRSHLQLYLLTCIRITNFTKRFDVSLVNHDASRVRLQSPNITTDLTHYPSVLTSSIPNVLRHRQSCIMRLLLHKAADARERNRISWRDAFHSTNKQRQIGLHIHTWYYEWWRGLAVTRWSQST